MGGAIARCYFSSCKTPPWLVTAFVERAVHEPVTREAAPAV